MDRHIGLRSEELQFAARAAGNVENLTRQAVAGVKTVTVIEKSTVETLALLYKDLKKRKPSTKPKAVQQASLL